MLNEELAPRYFERDGHKDIYAFHDHKPNLAKHRLLRKLIPKLGAVKFASGKNKHLDNYRKANNADHDLMHNAQANGKKGFGRYYRRTIRYMNANGYNASDDKSFMKMVKDHKFNQRMVDDFADISDNAYHEQFGTK